MVKRLGEVDVVRLAMYGILLLEYCVTGTQHTCISTTFPVHCTLYTTCVWASVAARVCQHAIQVNISSQYVLTCSCKSHG